jgi:enoyl-CoA hydratase
VTDAHVRCERHGPRADVVISRPEKRNALTADMMREIVGHVSTAAADDDVKVIVLRADGPLLTAGFDIADPASFEGLDEEPVRSRIASISEKATWMRDLLQAPKPTILKVRGGCIGIGTMLLLVSDFAIVADDASFGFPEERLGSAGATWAYPFLTMSIGLKRATEILMTGRRLDAAEVERWGLVNQVVPLADLERSVDSLAEAICSLPRDGIAVNRAAKRLVLNQLGFDACFDLHGVVHPLAERLERGPDEYDFMRSVSHVGLAAAIKERNDRFDGRWWRW